MMDWQAAAAAFLTGLAKGEFDPQVEKIDKWLVDAAAVFPLAGIAHMTLKAFLAINRQTAPGLYVADGQGGFVPATNSRYNPKTGRFLKYIQEIPPMRDYWLDEESGERFSV